jgi:hypothetical protein
MDTFINPVHVTGSAENAPVYSHEQEQSTIEKLNHVETTQPVATDEKVQTETDPKVSAQERTPKTVSQVDLPKIENQTAATSEKKPGTEILVEGGQRKPFSPGKEEGLTNTTDSDPLSGKPVKNATDHKRTHRIFMTGKELFNLPVKSEPFLLENLIPSEVMMVLSGDSDSGKSLWALNLAVGIVTGSESFVGLKLQPKHKAVLIVSTEDGVKDLALRVQKIVRPEQEDHCQNLHFCFANGDKTKNRVADFLAKTKADLVVFDVAGDIFKGNPNDITDVRDFFNEYKSLIEKHGCSLLFLHHTRKGSGKESANKDQTLGSQAWTAAPRGLLMLKKESNHLDDNARTLWLSKGNFAPESVKNTPVYMTFESDTLRFTESKSFTRSADDGPGSLSKRTDPKFISAVLELKDKDLTLAGMVEVLNANGLIIGKTTVSEILNDHKKGEVKLDSPNNLLG